MVEGMEKDYTSLIEKLHFYSEQVEDSSLKQLLIEASQAISDLSDFSIDLIDSDGNVLYSISDSEGKQIMLKAVDDFIQNINSAGNASGRFLNNVE